MAGFLDVYEDLSLDEKGRLYVGYVGNSWCNFGVFPVDVDFQVFSEKIEQIVNKSVHAKTSEWCNFCHAAFPLCPLLEVSGVYGVYHFPSMIVHLIEKHLYLPPREFIDAVMSHVDDGDNILDYDPDDEF